MNELKPCPFCGGEAEIFEDYEIITKYVTVRCSKCFAKIQNVTASIYFCAEDKAIEMWNTRAESEGNNEIQK